MGLLVRVNHPQPDGRNVCVTQHPNGCVTVGIHRGEAFLMDIILPPRYATDEDVEVATKQLLARTEGR